jgi:hypothetical protein
VFNPRPTVSTLPIADDAVGVVIDDALTDPQALVDLSVRHRAAFAPSERNAFPGLELPLPPTVLDRFGECFAQHARGVLGARRTLSATGRLSMVTLMPEQLSPIQRVCHRDRLAASANECVAAGVLYLFRDEALGGTAFYRPRADAGDIEQGMQHWSRIGNAQFTRETGWPPAYMTQGNAVFDKTGELPARWNRLVFYDGSRFHCSHIRQPQLLSADPARGRLTINLFFVCRRTVQSGT